MALCSNQKRIWPSGCLEKELAVADSDDNRNDGGNGSVVTVIDDVAVHQALANAIPYDFTFSEHRPTWHHRLHH